MKYNLVTKNGHQLFEVASAFQKAIRRGLEDDALHWGVELNVSNFGEYAWKRIKIMCSEDIGLAENNLPANISALYTFWKEQNKKKDGKHEPQRLFLVHAILLLVRAKKSRLVDHALMTYYGKHEKIDIPEYAYDKHTLKGKRMGRGWKYFFDESIKLENRSNIKDIYLEKAKKIKIENEDSELFN